MIQCITAIIQLFMMYQYPFLSSPFCFKSPEANKQINTFQCLLPPDSELPKLGRQNRDLYRIQDDISRKNQQISYLSEKNHELLTLISQKEAQQNRFHRKYNQLLLMYQQLKSNGTIMSKEAQLNIMQQNKLLTEKIRKLERELIESQKQIIRKVKFYEEKNEDSRKLLEKLNQNITKRQQKFKNELLQAQNQLQKKTEALMKLQQQYHELQNISHQRQDQMTKILQQTERDRSAFSQNISSIEIKLQNQNIKLNQEIAHLKQTITNLRRQNNDKLKQTSQGFFKIQQTYQKIKMRYQNTSAQLDQSNARLEQLQLQYKLLEGKYRLLQAQNTDNLSKLRNKNAQILHQTNHNRELIRLIQELKLENTQTQQKLKNIKSQNDDLRKKANANQIQLQKYKIILKEKVDHLTGLEFNLQQQIQENKNIYKQNEGLRRQSDELEAKLKKSDKQILNLQELLKSYKTENIKIRTEADIRWKQMSQFYQKQILKLSSKLLANSKKANSKGLVSSNIDYYSS